MESKKFNLLKGLCLSLSIAMGSFLWAGTPENATKKRGIALGLVQTGAGMRLDQQHRVRGGAMVAWVPTYHFSSTLAARWSVGLMFRNAFAKDDMTVGDISLTFIEKPKNNSPLFGEVGAGVQYWTQEPSRKFYPAGKAGFGYQFGDGNRFIKSFQLSYTYVINDPLKTHQLLGVFTLGL